MFALCFPCVGVVDREGLGLLLSSGGTALTADELLHGWRTLTVEVDRELDVCLVRPDGSRVETRRANYPYEERLSRGERRARLEAMRHVLSQFDYTGKGLAGHGVPDPLVVGAPTLTETDRFQPL